MRQIVLDTETTGIDPKQGHRIIEIGCVELIDRKLTGNHFHEYINPEREVEEEALAVHGISNEFLADKPVFADLVDGFLDFIEGAELVIHNAPFDIGFMDHEFRLAQARVRKTTKVCSVIDTLVMARKMHPGQRNNLDALCKRYGVDNKHRDLHGALLDAEILANVYLMMTGGQTSLFTGGEKKEESAVEQVERSTRKRSLLVQRATEEELTAHSEYLQKLKNDEGVDLWG
jgi:DNA polymerase-3 subunit epsilon